jgi:protein TonB
VEGKVRVRVSIDENGSVTGVELVSGLGHGLDEAALGAARSARFEPATRCGKPVASSFVIAMRFVL